MQPPFKLDERIQIYSLYGACAAPEQRFDDVGSAGLCLNKKFVLRADKNIIQSTSSAHQLSQTESIMLTHKKTCISNEKQRLLL